jgi:HD-GYP domain-containing protein (c-di-GMP phosphodiesterase class II)
MAGRVTAWHRVFARSRTGLRDDGWMAAEIAARRPARRPPVRAADLTIALALGADLGTGMPLEHGLRTCWLAVRAAEELGLDAGERSAVFHTALLRFIGCTSDASETAVLAGGDDLAFNATMAPMFNAAPATLNRYFVRHLAEDLPLPRRAARIARALRDPSAGERSLRGHCEVAQRLGVRLGMDAAVTGSLAHAYERWDGHGLPDGLAGEEIPVPVRIAVVARDVEIWTRMAGWPAAGDVVRQRRGRAYDPAVVDVLTSHGHHWLDELGDDAGATVLAAEPEPVVTIEPAGLEAALTAIADFADIKSVWTRGHSRGVARLVDDAAVAAGLDHDRREVLRSAALVHDVGRVGVANAIWDKPASLTREQFERVRLHPYLTERILAHCEFLSSLAPIAGAHHERMDGSGYHRGAAAGQLAEGSQLVAAADAYHAMTEARPHRPARSSAAAATQLRQDTDDGRYDATAVEAVLTAAGHTVTPAAVQRPAGLTEREVEVLGLLARGHLNKQVARTLGISPKTVGSHVEHIYAKTGVSTRAGATLFAMEHGLVAD